MTADECMMNWTVRPTGFPAMATRTVLLGYQFEMPMFVPRPDRAIPITVHPISSILSLACTRFD